VKTIPGKTQNIKTQNINIKDEESYFLFLKKCILNHNYSLVTHRALNILPYL